MMIATCSGTMLPFFTGFLTSSVAFGEARLKDVPGACRARGPEDYGGSMENGLRKNRTCLFPLVGLDHMATQAAVLIVLCDYLTADSGGPRRAAGILSRNSTVGGPVRVSSARPPCASTTARAMARPRPVPPLSERVVTKRRNARWRTCAGTVPAFATCTTTSLPSRRTPPPTREDACECTSAL